MKLLLKCQREVKRKSDKNIEKNIWEMKIYRYYNIGDKFVEEVFKFDFVHEMIMARSGMVLPLKSINWIFFSGNFLFPVKRGELK